MNEYEYTYNGLGYTNIMEKVEEAGALWFKIPTCWYTVPKLVVMDAE